MVVANFAAHRFTSLFSLISFILQTFTISRLELLSDRLLTMIRLKLKNMKTAVGEADESEVFLSETMTGQPSTSTSKLADCNFLDDPFDTDLGMLMVEDAEGGFVDTLGDASMDSFTDLNGILMEPQFLGQLENKDKAEDNPTLTFLNLQPAMISQQQPSLKRSFADMDESSSDLAKLSASVGLTRSRTPSQDHDYSTKRARRSPTPTQALADSAAVPSFLVPDVSPVSSPSPDTTSSSGISVNKQKQRRDKNNMASKRSREIRKQKFVNMEKEAVRLSEENAQLERRVLELEKLAQDMKQILVTKMKIKT